MVDCNLLRVAREMPMVASFSDPRSASDFDYRSEMVYTPASIRDLDFFPPAPVINVTGSFW